MLKTLKALCTDLASRAKEVDIVSRSAQVAFFLIFSIFPFLIFVLSVIGIFLGQSEYYKTQLLMYLQELMPNSSFILVRDTIEQAMSASTSSKVTLGLFVSLWSASSGFNSLRIALNSAYGFTETRPYLRTRLTAIFLTSILTVFFIVSMGGLLLGSKFLGIIIKLMGLRPPSEGTLNVIQWIVAIGTMFFVFELIYNILPNRKPFMWTWITPGSIVGVILSLSASVGLNVYLKYFNDYDRTYGSIGAVIVLMLWLLLSAMVVIIGGMINSIVETKYGLQGMKIRKLRKYIKEKYVTNAS